MLAFCDDCLHEKNLRYRSILSTDTDDQRMLQSDWTRRHIWLQPNKLVVLNATFLWSLSHCKILMDRLIPSWDIYDQRVP